MKCPICNKDLGELTPAHAKTHGMTRAEMYELYPEIKDKNFNFGRKDKDPNTVYAIRNNFRRTI